MQNPAFWMSCFKALTSSTSGDSVTKITENPWLEIELNFSIPMTPLNSSCLAIL
jgi:hypothetical protein